MRIGIRLGGSVIRALFVVLGVTAGAQAADRVTTIPLGGSLENQSGDHHYGVYVPTRFGGELTIKTTHIAEEIGGEEFAFRSDQIVGTDTTQ